MSYSISVVIPNFNGRELLEKNITSVYSALKSSNISEYEIIISDDASSDDSVEFIRSNYPDIFLIPNFKNMGFAGNTNVGIRAAKMDLVLILNSDVQLTDNYFTSLMPYFDKEDTFGVMGRIIGFDSDKIQDGAKYPDCSFGNIVSTKNYICETETSLYSLFLSGANALVDRKKIQEMGCFDEIFNPYYAEDVDLSLRAWKLGYKVYYEHSAICKHPNSATIKKEPSNKVKIISKRNKFYLHYLHLEGLELRCFLFVLGIKSILRLIFMDFNYLKSMKMFVKSIDKLKKSKEDFRKMQIYHKSNKTTDDIVKYIINSLEGKEIKIF